MSFWPAVALGGRDIAEVALRRGDELAELLSPLCCCPDDLWVSVLTTAGFGFLSTSGLRSGAAAFDAGAGAAEVFRLTSML
jgi:hypothetical protein